MRRRLLISLCTGVLMIVGFLFVLLSVGFGYLIERWQLFFETCAGVSRSVFDYFSHVDHVGMMVALLVVLLGVGYMCVVALYEFVSTMRMQAKLRQSCLRMMSDHVCITSDKQVYALTIGFLRPRIYISEGMLRTLSTRAVDAVIAHEEYHRVHRHPLQKFLVLLCQSLFFYLPGSQGMLSWLLLRQEIAADRAAIRSTSRISLAEALLLLYGEPVRAKLQSVSFFSSLSARVDVLVGNSVSFGMSQARAQRLMLGVMVCAFVFGFILLLPQYSSATLEMDIQATTGQFCEGALQSSLQSLLQ